MKRHHILPDYKLLIAAYILIAFGISMVYSSSIHISKKIYHRFSLFTLLDKWRKALGMVSNTIRFSDGFTFFKTLLNINASILLFSMSRTLGRFSIFIKNKLLQNFKYNSSNYFLYPRHNFSWNGFKGLFLLSNGNTFLMACIYWIWCFLPSCIPL